MGSVINGYALTGEFTTAGAGMCRWSFATRDNHEYFIKEFLSPKYPVDEGMLGPDLTKIMRQHADQFYLKRQFYYESIVRSRTGNIMAPVDFFRSGAKYYAVTDKVSGKLLDVGEVAALTEDGKLTLIKSLLYSMSQLHGQKIVHSDLKPENILIKTTEEGFCTAKIIDFDAGFFEDDIPENIEGSQNYFAPEMLRRMNGEDIDVTVKADVFALGLLMHQYWCGEMPGISEKYNYTFEAVLNDSPVALDPSIPEQLRELIGSMLAKEADKRPSAEEAWKRLRGVSAEHAEEAVPMAVPKKEDRGVVFLHPSEDELD